MLPVRLRYAGQGSVSMKQPVKTFYAYIDQDANGVFIRFVGPDDPLYDVARNQYIDRMIQLEKKILGS